MRRFLVFLLVLLAFTNAMAFEADIQGGYSFEYWYFSRLGTNDLFGNVNLAQSPLGPQLTTIGFSGPYNGTVFPEGLSSKGSDASWTQELLRFDIGLKANPSVGAKFRISFQTDLNGPYQAEPSWSAPKHYNGRYRSMSRPEEVGQAITSPVLNFAYGYWKLPWGTLVFGRYPMAFGAGWSGLHYEDSTITMVGLKVPYGPLSFFLAHELGNTGEYTSPYDSRNLDGSLLTLASSVDRNEIRKWGSVYAVEYGNAGLQIGYLNHALYYSNVHVWPNVGQSIRDDRSGALLPNMFLNSFRTFGEGADATIYPIYGDALLMTNVIYMKYANGRFFTNLEYDFQYLKASRIGGRPISGWPKAWYVDAGAIAGPARLTLAALYRSGHDRRGGLLDTVSSTGTNTFTAQQVGDSWNQYVVLAGGHQCMEPYTLVLGYYGTGNNSYDSVGNPTYVDFLGLAGRFDYAVAANLNTWVSYLFARRASNSGSWWAQYNGGIGTAVERGSNVPNNDLGWELSGGISWKLLENAVLTTKVGYWKPGNWFKHAYQDYSTTVLVDDPVSGDAVRINPDRGIDPILGVMTGLEIKL